MNRPPKRFRHIGDLLETMKENYIAPTTQQPGEKNYFCVVPKGKIGRGKYKKREIIARKRLIGLAAAYRKNSGHFPVFLIFSEEDADFCKRAAETLGGIAVYGDFARMHRLMAKASAVFSSRYHASVLARAYKLPLVTLSPDPKLAEFCSHSFSCEQEDNNGIPKQTISKIHIGCRPKIVFSHNFPKRKRINGVAKQTNE